MFPTFNVNVLNQMLKDEAHRHITLYSYKLFILSTCNGDELKKNVE